MPDAFGFSSPLGPFDSAGPGQTPLLLVRLALLFCVVLVPTKRFVVPALGALFVASITLRILVLPDLLASVAAVFVCVPRRLAVGAAIGAALGVAVVCIPPGAPAPRPGTIAEWRARKNLWHVRALALEAAKHEVPPGAAYLELAQVDVDLGRRDQARKVLEKVRLKGTDDDRAKAAALEAAW